MSGIVRSGDTNERHARGLRTARIIYRVAQVPDVFARILLLDQCQSVGCGLWDSPRIRRSPADQIDVAGVAAQRGVGFILHAAGKDGQRGAFC